MIADITDQDFEQEVIKGDKPAMVDMWAPWCGPCKMIHPIVEKLSAQYDGKLKFLRMNIDENPLTPARYRVMSIPTLLFFKGGEVADTVIGVVPERTITPKIEALL